MFFKEGQIVWIDFPYSDIPDEKNRPAFVWKDNGNELVVSMITSRIRGLEWEVLIAPTLYNSLSRQSVIRVDNTIVISKEKLTAKIPEEAGFAGPFVVAVAKEKMSLWLTRSNQGLKCIVEKSRSRRPRPVVPTR